MHPALQSKSTELEQLCVRHRVRRLSVFGSASRGGFEPGASDFDFLVDFLPMPPGDHAENYFNLMEDLERLFDAGIDLVESQPIRNPYFRRSVEASLQSLYDAA